MKQATHSNDYIMDRLLAYILPRKPESPEQWEAMREAAESQADFEFAFGLGDLPGNLTGLANDGVRVTFTPIGTREGYTQETISPAAWAILRNAGLIAYTLPTARKP